MEFRSIVNELQVAIVDVSLRESVEIGECGARQ